MASLNVKRVLLMSATVRMLWNAFVVARNCVLMKRLKFALNKFKQQHDVPLYFIIQFYGKYDYFELISFLIVRFLPIIS